MQRRGNVGPEAKASIPLAEYWAAYDALPPAIRAELQQAEFNVSPVAALKHVRAGCSPARMRAKLQDHYTAMHAADYGPQHPRSQRARQVY